MSKDVWHRADEKPMLQRDIILCGDGWSMAMDIIPETVNNICWKNVEKWCYVDDLIKENDRTRKALDRAKWWLKEIVESHRCTPISTAEMALKEVNALDDCMIRCTILDIPESYKKLHKAVESANVKLANKYDIAIDALCEIKKHKQRLCLDDVSDIIMDIFDIAEQAIEKIKEK